DLSNMMPEVSQAGITSNLLQKSAQQQLIYRRLLDALFNDVYNNHTSNLVSQSNNKYTLTLRGAQLIDVAKPAAIYTINNIDKLSTTLKTFLNSLTPAEITDLGLTNEIKGQALQGLDLMVLAVNQDRSKYLQEIENMSATSKDELLKTINDSELVASIEKADSKTYNTASKLHVDVTVDNPADRLEFTLNTKDTMIAGGTVQVAAPTTGLITLTELQQRLPRELTVNVDSGFYTQSNGLFSDSGKMNVQMVNSRTYLPLRLTGESLGEEVGWDQASHQAYVMQNGQRINMNGIIVNSRTYIKIRDFEQLGFKVGWNDAVRTVTIEK
ncbi:MAG: copper amine oxidase N-terminal domain-containing protein, partial [Syntrophomonas sp.]